MLSSFKSESTAVRTSRRAIAVLVGLLQLLLGVSPAWTQVVVDPAADLRNFALARGTNSLKTVPVPPPPNSGAFMRDRQALRVLGKALFWDQQVGSDGQACASCHFHAGADNRSTNQLNPGFRNQAIPGGDTVFSVQPVTPPGWGPNYQLTASDFPFHQLADVNDRTSAVLRDTNDVASSQGVFNAAFTAIGIPGDTGVPSFTGSGAVFNVGVANVGPVLVRNVEPRNTPTVINAALNHRNFWDGRARFEFNGVNPIGALDPTAVVVKQVPTGPGLPPTAKLVQVRIANSSTASQADGPPLSDLEMSFAGRRFPEVGRKMLDPNLVTLGQQVVAPDDSLLGPYTHAPGLSLKYADLIIQAFQPAWWNLPGWIVDLGTGKPVLKQAAITNPKTQFTVMEFNFSLYFGLAVREYEATLIADDSPFDRFMDGNLTALSEQQQNGLRTFLGQGRCINCHGGPELTNASTTNVQNFEMLERMIMGNDRVAVYDNGFYNIGVRPTLEDIGIGATIGPLNLPLSNSRFFQNRVKQLMAQGLTLQQANQQAAVPRIRARPAEALKLLLKAAGLAGNPPTVTALLDQANALLVAVPPDPTGASALLVQARDLLAAAALGTPVQAPVTDLLAQATMLLPDPIDPGPDPLKPFGPLLRPDERVAVDGAHKTPSPRTSELTAPYFHNGGMATLEQVVEFYNRGSDFGPQNQDNFDVDIQPLFLTDQQKADLVAFLKALTDNRVRFETAPFDHPSLNVPNGGSTGVVTTLFGVPVIDDRVQIPAVGAGGCTTSAPACVDATTGAPAGLGMSGTPFANFLQRLTP